MMYAQPYKRSDLHGFKKCQDKIMLETAHSQLQTTETPVLVEEVPRGMAIYWKLFTLRIYLLSKPFYWQKGT